MAGSTTSSKGPGSRPTKSERREAAREKARAFREERERRARRKRLLIQLSVILVAVLVVVGVFVVIQQVNRSKGPGAVPANMASDGLVVTKGLEPVRTDARAAGSDPEPYESVDGRLVVTVYADFMCPACGSFEQTYGQYLSTQAQAGNIDLEIHPVGLLDRYSSGSKYSTRAAAAAASVANYAPDHFMDFFTTLFQDGVQPSENTTGLTDDQLVEYARQAVGDDQPEVQDQVEKSIRNGEFQKWVAQATQAANLSATPTVKLDGEEWDMSGDLTEAIDERLRASGIDPDAAADAETSGESDTTQQ
ncbi:MAG: Thioredoxin domain-containing protein [Pseudoclavibacter caeni]|jgi:protein-disulfide isomerase